MVEKWTVLLDNGHGKDTAGKRSPVRDDGTRLYEWLFNRQLVERIIPLLEVNGVKAVQIVYEDYDVSLTERYTRVQRYVKQHPEERCVFLSIHGNAAGNGGWMNARGWCAYTTKGQNESDKLAECLYDAAQAAYKDLAVRTNMADGDRDWEANFSVIYGVDHASNKAVRIPAVLIEHFFYDNKQDCELMLSEDGQERMAMVDVEGVLRYFNGL